MKCNVLTVEIEHVDTFALESIANANANVSIQPDFKTVRIIQDKFAQKEFLSSKMESSEVLITPYRNLIGPGLSSLADELKDIAKEFKYPMMLKSKRLAYDGRGNYVIKSEYDIQSAIIELGAGERELYVEKWVPFTKELAVMVAKGIHS